MNGFLHIKKIILPRSVMEDVYAFLREMGQKHVEGVAVLAGKGSGTSFTVSQGLIPAQKSYQLEAGLLYAVDGEELHRINVWLHKNNLTLIAQIHTHPGEAYHSDTDDRYPIVDTHGCVSIVVPDFAQFPLAINEWAVFRLIPGIGWNELGESEVSTLIELV